MRQAFELEPAKSRRRPRARWPRACAVFCASAFAANSPALAQGGARAPIEAYAVRTSLRAGEELQLCVSAQPPRELSVELRRVGDPHGEAAHRECFRAESLPIPVDAPSTGCNWPAVMRIEVLAEWPGGYYVARIGAADDAAVAPACVGLLIRATTSPPPRVLVLRSICTEIATNRFATTATYPHAIPVRSSQCPLVPPGNASLASLECFFAWLESLGLPLAYIEDRDLHSDPRSLDECDLLIVAGSSAFWSRSMRDALDTYLGNGGRALILSGNTCSAQIRLERGGDLLYYYHDPRNDPLFASERAEDRRELAMPYALPPLADPEDRTLAIGHRHATHATALGRRHPYGPWRGIDPDHPYEAGFGYYRIAQPDHPFFRGLALAEGDLLGVQSVQRSGQSFSVITVSGHCDGASLEGRGGRLVASPGAGAPPDLLVLAVAPASTGFVTLADHAAFGRVVNAGTRNFAYLPFGVVPGCTVPAIQRFAENAVRDLSAPRRSLLRNGGFELWKDGVPLHSDVDGRVQPMAEDAVSGKLGARLEAGAALRVRLTGGGVERSACGAFVRAFGPGGRMLVRRIADGRVLAARDLPPAGRAYAWLSLPAREHEAMDREIVIAAPPHAELGVDNLEWIGEEAARRESSDLDAATAVAGGRAYLLLGRVERPARVHLRDGGSTTAAICSSEVSVDAGEMSALVELADPGRMIRCRVEALDASGVAVAVDRPRLLPLHVAARAATDREPLSSEGEGWRQWTFPCGAVGERRVLSFWYRGGPVRGELRSERASDALASFELEARESWTALQREVEWPQASATSVPGAETQLALRCSGTAEFEHVRLRSAERIVVEDLYGNGDFEIQPSAREIERGSDWTMRVPNWARSENAELRLDAERAFTGRAALRIDCEKGEAWASSVIPDSLSTDARVRVRAKVRVEGAQGVALELRALDPFELTTRTLAAWRGSADGTWESAALAVHPSALRDAFASGWYQGWIYLSLAGPGSAWIDELTVEVDR